VDIRISSRLEALVQLAGRFVCDPQAARLTALALHHKIKE